MLNDPHFNEQKELFQALRKQLEASDLEVAKQKWLFEKFLQSPSWRLTLPLRRLAARLRALRRWMAGAPQETQAEGDPRTRNSAEHNVAHEVLETGNERDSLSRYRTTLLRNLLSTAARLDLFHNENPEMSVIMVLSGQAQLALTCLCSLREHGSGRLQVFIVNNAESDNVARLLERVDGAHVIRGAGSASLPSTISEAARRATGRYLLLLGCDVQPLTGSISAAISTLQSSSDIGAVCGRIIGADGLLQEAGGILWSDGMRTSYGAGDDPFGPMYMFRRDVDCGAAAFLVTPREIWERLAGFDETIEVTYAGENYCARLCEAGLRIIYDPNVSALHLSESPVRPRAPSESFNRRHARLLADQCLPDSGSVLKARSRCQRKRVLFIDDRVPHAWLGSGLPRARAILLSLVKQGYFVTFYPMDLDEGDWLSVYSDMPDSVEFLMGCGRLMLEAFLSNRPGYYDTLLISRPHNMELLRSIRIGHPDWFRGTTLIYDAEALFARREISRQDLSGKPYREEEARRRIREETALASGVDAVISVSEFERDSFLENGIPRVHVLGHALETRPTPRQFGDRTGFLFVGAIHEDSDPNGDAVLWFLTDVFPKIRAELGEDVPMTIAGVNDSEKIHRFAGTSVRINGFVKDLADVYDSARVFVAPTRYAAGIPHKVHEAAAYGLPIVATPLLADQLGWRDGETLCIGTGADSFARKCIDLYTNDALWTKLRRAALDRVKAECSPEAFESRLKEILAASIRESPATPPAI